MSSRTNKKRKSNQLESVSSLDQLSFPNQLKNTFEGKPEWISSQNDFNNAFKIISQENIISFDTEFIGEESFHRQLCLVQLATQKNIFLIDPLSNIDLQPLWNLIGNKSICKIVHAGIQDLEFSIRLGGETPKNIFDTQIAAAIAGLPYPIGLSKLLPIFSKINIGNSQTLTDWKARPLSNAQVEYAANDVRFLIYLYECLTKKIKNLNREDWLKEEFLPLETTSHYDPPIDGHVRRLLKGKNASEETKAIMERLTKIRLEIAEFKDMPPRSTLPDEVLISLSKKRPENLEQLQLIKGYPRNLDNLFNEKIYNCFKNTEKYSKKSPKLLPAHERVLNKSKEDGIWALFCAFCFNNKIEPSFVTSRHYFQVWINENITKDCPMNSNWRKYAIADHFRELLDGKISLKWNQEVNLLNNGKGTSTFN